MMNVNNAQKSDVKNLRTGIFAFSFLFFAFVSWCTPLSSDDLVFATVNGDSAADYLKFILEYGNGRFLGNLSAVILNVYPAVAVLIKAFVLASCCILLPDILGSDSLWEHLWVLFLFICMDPTLFGETFVWNSGFGNYIPPIWMTMIIVCLLKRYAQRSSREKNLVCAAIGLLGFCSQLYVEHTSGINLLLASCAVVGCVALRREERKPCVLWLISTVVGLGVMLLLPKIFYVPGNHADSYRQMNVGGLVAMAVSAAKNGIKLVGAYFGPCTLTVCAGAGAAAWLSREHRSQKMQNILVSLCGSSAVYLAVNLLAASSRYMGKSAMIQHIFDTVFFMIPLAVWLIAVWQMERGQMRNQQLFCLAFAAVSIAPLLIVSTVPNRVILQSYLFIIAAAVLCIRPILRAIPAKMLTRAAISLVLVSSFVVGNIFFSIRNMTQLRENYIRSEISAGSTEVEIFYIPYDYGSWDHIWIATYYGAERNNVEFINIGFDYWMGSHY